MLCKFVQQLSQLRKSSAEAIENTDSFAVNKQYLHVERTVERELRQLLRRVNETSHKSLVLLCGSAGDGKSHLMSYLKHADSEGLLDSFELYNDATESSEPSLTAIETLAGKLSSFSDVNYHIEDGKKMIIAINLGMLNNFIMSEQGKSFSLLKTYVESNGIFSLAQNFTPYQEDSVFHHVSFSDYQVFALSSQGIVTTYLEELFHKVFQATESNAFYFAYQSNSSCPLCKRCPVRHNYEFLSNPDNQKYVIQRIVEVVLKDKAIVSTREVLNLIYDLLVHPDFDYAGFVQATTEEVTLIENYLRFTTPMILNEGSDISSLLNNIILHDPLKSRKATIDNEAMHFHSLEEIGNSFLSVTVSTPYAILNDVSTISHLGAMKPELKKLVYKFLIRTKDFNGHPYQHNPELFNSYIAFLYSQNTGNTRNQRNLYNATKKAIYKWNGDFGDNVICIDDTNEYYWVLERLYIKPFMSTAGSMASSEPISRFKTTLHLAFCKDNDPENYIAEIDIDYSLFEMIFAMRNGYRPTWQDKNLHTDFVSFVQNIIGFGEKATHIIIMPKNGERNVRYTYSADDFGPEFKEVIT